MNNLLAANRMRIMKSKFFWFGMHLGLVWGTLYLIIVLRDATSPSALPYTTTTPFILMEAFTLTAVFCPFFCSLFIGTDYSDGTLRNKILAGHSRSSIYLTNFISVFLANLWIALVCTLLILLSLLLPEYSVDQPVRLLFFYFCGVLNIASFSGLFTLISMLIDNKTTAVIICLGTYIASTSLSQILVSFVLPYYYQSLDTSRPPEWMLFLCSFLPTGTHLQLTRTFYADGLLNVDGLSNLPRLAVYSVFFTAITLICGIALFQKKDLK